MSNAPISDDQLIALIREAEESLSEFEIPHGVGGYRVVRLAEQAGIDLYGVDARSVRSNELTVFMDRLILFPKLRSLKIGINTFDEDAIAYLLQHLPLICKNLNLITFVVQLIGNIREGTVERILESASHWSELEELSILGGTKGNTSLLKSYAKNWPKLRYLRFPIGRSPDELKTVSEACQDFSELVGIELYEGFPTLEDWQEDYDEDYDKDEDDDELEVPLETETSFSEFFRSLANRRLLQRVGIPQAFDSILAEVEPRGQSELHLLDLGDCSNLTKSGYQKIQKLCDSSFISEVFLLGCAEIEPDDLIPILETLARNNSDCSVVITGTHFLPNELEGNFETPRVLLHHLRGARQSARLFGEVKLLFLGQGGVGKTHAARWLLGDQEYFNVEHIETFPFEIIRNSIDIKVRSEEPKDKVRLNCWDFGGQNELHAAHRLFFQVQRCMYILVVDMSRSPNGNEQSNRLNYWLRLINHYSKTEIYSAPVLVVKTKCDLKDEHPKAFAENSAALEAAKKQSYWGDNFHISLADDFGWKGKPVESPKASLENLTNQLLSLIPQIPDVAATYPESAIRFKDVISYLFPPKPDIDLADSQSPLKHFDFLSDLDFSFDAESDLKNAYLKQRANAGFENGIVLLPDFRRYLGRLKKIEQDLASLGQSFEFNEQNRKAYMHMLRNVGIVHWGDRFLEFESSPRHLPIGSDTSWHDDAVGFRKIVFNPNWIKHPLKLLLDKSHAKHTSGFMTQQQMEQTLPCHDGDESSFKDLFKFNSFTPEERADIVNLLKLYRIIFDVERRDKTKYFVPDLCEPSGAVTFDLRKGVFRIPEEKIVAKDYVCDVLPEWLFMRFVARNHDRILNDEFGGKNSGSLYRDQVKLLFDVGDSRFHVVMRAEYSPEDMSHRPYIHVQIVQTLGKDTSNLNSILFLIRQQLDGIASEEELPRGTWQDAALPALLVDNNTPMLDFLAALSEISKAAYSPDSRRNSNDEKLVKRFRDLLENSTEQFQHYILPTKKASAVPKLDDAKFPQDLWVRVLSRNKKVPLVDGQNWAELQNRRRVKAGDGREAAFIRFDKEDYLGGRDATFILDLDGRLVYSQGTGGTCFFAPSVDFFGDAGKSWWTSFTTPNSEG